MEKEELIQYFEAESRLSYKGGSYSERAAFEIGAMVGYQKAQEWISVEDRLPEREGNGFVRCLVVRTTGTKVVVFEAVFNNVIRDFLQLNFENLDNITHWQPLPTAPSK